MPNGKTNPSSYTIETDTFTLNNPTRFGFNFIGWTGTGLSSASTSVSVSKGSKGDRTYTANWKDASLPTCTTSKSNTGSTDGVTVSITCSDVGSGCSSSNTLSYTGVKESATYTVKDNAGNQGSCDVSVSSQSQKRTRTCSAYNTCQNSACGNCPYCSAGSYACVDSNGDTWSGSSTMCIYGVPCTCVWNCSNYADRDCTCANAACGCETYSDWSGWTNDSCSPDDYTECRTVYN